MTALDQLRIGYSNLLVWEELKKVANADPVFRLALDQIEKGLQMLKAEYDDIQP